MNRAQFARHAALAIGIMFVVFAGIYLILLIFMFDL